MSTTFTWDGSSNAWNTNHWGRSGVSPQWPGDTGSSTTDTVLVNLTSGQSPPTSGPGAALTIGYLGVSGFNAGTAVWNNLTVSQEIALGISNSASQFMQCPMLSSGPLYSMVRAGIGSNAGFATVKGLLFSDILSSTTEGAAFGGTATSPPANSVLTTAGGNYVAPMNSQLVQGQSCGVSGSIAGTQYVPAAANVLSGVSTGTTTGQFVAPAAAQMVQGQSCGISGSIAGTQHIPAAQYVYAGVNTGTTAGTLHAGNLHSGAGAPARTSPPPCLWPAIR